jgi:hypothetical protein
MSKAKRHSSNLTSSFELPDKQKLAIADKDLETHRTPAMSPSGPSRHLPRCSDTSGIGMPAQPVDATQALNLSAGVSNCKVSRGRSFS